MSKLILALAVASLAAAPVSSVSSDTAAPVSCSSGELCLPCEPGPSCDDMSACPCDPGECPLAQNGAATAE
jgi:hypothetical protein